MGKTIPDLVRVKLETGRQKLRERRNAEMRRTADALLGIRAAASELWPDLVEFLDVRIEDPSKGALDGMCWIVLPGMARIGVAMSAWMEDGWDAAGPYEIERHYGDEERIEEEDLATALALAEEFGNIGAATDDLFEGLRRCPVLKGRPWWRRWLGW